MSFRYPQRRNPKRSSIIIANIKKLCILTAAIVLGGGGFWLLLEKAPQKEKDKHNLFYQDLPRLVEALQKRWIEGDFEGLYSQNKFTCTDRVANGENLDASYFQCNPYYLMCFLEGRAGQKPSKIFKSFEFPTFGFNRRGALVVGAKHKATGKKVFTKFEDTCGQVLLPESTYSAGPLEGSLYLWDNYGQNIWIDKWYVTNGDVKVWLDQFDKIGDPKKEIAAGEFHRPSTSLSLEQKKDYCQFRGGQLLQSRHFDAATFLPSQVENNYIYKFPYPWTKSKDAVRFWEEAECEKIFSKECQRYEYHSTYAPSWIGIYHSLGSYVEVFENKFFPAANLKASSRHLPMDSPWHRLGLRASQDPTLEVNHYNGKELALNLGSEKLKRSAFRCAYYR